MLEKIVAIISQVTQIPQEKLLQNKDTEKMWESLMFVEIVIELETQFGVTFEQDEIAQMTTVNKIVDLVQSKQ